MVNSKEILTCLIFIAIGYLIAKMFSRCTNGVVNGFSVGGQIDCDQYHDDLTCSNHFENNINPCIWRLAYPAMPERPALPARPAMPAQDAACVNAPNFN